MKMKISKAFKSSMGYSPKRPDYWLSRPVEERFAEMDRLTREKYGPMPRLDKNIVRIIKLSEDR